MLTLKNYNHILSISKNNYMAYKKFHRARYNFIAYKFYSLPINLIIFENLYTLSIADPASDNEKSSDVII